MADLKLDTVTQDLVMGTDLAFTIGIESVAQAIDLKTKSFKGEWFADLNYGVPYYQEILGQKPNNSRLSSTFRALLLGTDGVDSINFLTVSYNGTTRVTTVDWEVQVGTEVIEGSLDI